MRIVKLKKLFLMVVFVVIALSLSFMLLLRSHSEETLFEISAKKDTDFQDLYFEKNLRNFKLYHLRKDLNTTNNFPEDKIPFFILLPNIKPKRFWIQQMSHIVNNKCPLPCKFSKELKDLEKANAVMIHLDSFRNPKAVLKKITKERNPKQPWVMMSFETHLMANKYINIHYNKFNSFFNRTMYFRKDSDIIVNHGFIVSKNDTTLLPHDWVIPINNSSSVTYKPNATVIASFITNCSNKSGRLIYIRELSQFINVDIFGSCGKLRCGRSLFVGQGYKPNTERCLKKVGTSYMFYLAFENSFCKDYISEKVYNLLYYPIVPIVYGGANYTEVLPPNSYINAADYSPAKLAEYIKFLISNPTEYKKYLKWREYYSPSTVGGERILCDLCTRLHDPDFYEYNVVENFYKWFVEDAKCFRYS